MTTSTAFRTDEQIASDVLDELNFDGQLQPNNIGLSVRDGVVTLTGFVDSYLKRWTAEDLALRIRGVKAVANDIEIRLPSSAQRDDSELAAAALNAPCRSPGASPSSEAPKPDRGGSGGGGALA